MSGKTEVKEREKQRREREGNGEALSVSANVNRGAYHWHPGAAYLHSVSSWCQDNVAATICTIGSGDGARAAPVRTA